MEKSDHICTKCGRAYAYQGYNDIFLCDNCNMEEENKIINSGVNQDGFIYEDLKDSDRLSFLNFLMQRNHDLCIKELEEFRKLMNSEHYKLWKLSMNIIFGELTTVAEILERINELLIE